MAGSFLVLRRIVDISPWTLAMVFLVQSVSLANAFLYGQPYPLLLLLLCLSLAALLRGRPMLCGLALSPVVALKLYALPLLLRFVWAGRWRAASGAWVVFQSWAGGSWNIQAVERATGRLVSVTHAATNEVEPSWAPSGDRIVFASDRRRGRGFTALYEVPFGR